MAESTITLEIKWENNIFFEIKTREDAGPALTLVRMEENGEIAALWPAAYDLVERFMKATMARIGTEMKQP